MKLFKKANLFDSLLAMSMMYVSQERKQTGINGVMVVQSGPGKWTKKPPPELKIWCLHLHVLQHAANPAWSHQMVYE